MDKKLNFKNINGQLKKQWYLIILFPLFFGSLVWVSHTFFIPKIYVSTTQLLILPSNNSKDISSEQNIRLNMQLMNTFVTLVKSPKIKNQVREELKLTKEEMNMLNKLDISTDQNSLVITLKVKSVSSAKSKEIANLIAKIAETTMNNYFPHSKVEIFEDAQRGITLSNMKQYIAALIIGVWSSLIIIFVNVLKSSQIINEEDLKKYGFPVIGSIPYCESRDIFK
ncbi:Wzz/FepE/Etk N-terminal domain-containing protein [Bacillus cereus]|uniref:YveK family protein n=1 Tax=Bacillus cereus TaxID=1396 RepID=UPI0020422CC3|nr:Wzz/FepE/Etk N-terminal domain-containing protein [Bacillus cereus]MCM3222896.1 Wzz/FepE/Etk N-terminal domain-containing protein [Bacillus cereus]MEC3336057.1 Wzz/FepE/Etk N-terminal domain-containing protein [Bacillus cereus]